MFSQLKQKNKLFLVRKKTKSIISTILLMVLIIFGVVTLHHSSVSAKVVFGDYVALEYKCEDKGLIVDPAVADGWLIYLKSAEEGKAKFHLHVIFNIKDVPPHEITKILPKSSNWRSGEQIDLAQHPFQQWLPLVRDMDSRTQEATRLFKEVLEEMNAHQE